MKIVIEPSVINKPDNKNIRRGSLIFFMKKAAAIAPINDPALKAAWYAGVIIRDVLFSIIEIWDCAEGWNKPTPIPNGI